MVADQNGPTGLSSRLDTLTSTTYETAPTTPNLPSSWTRWPKRSHRARSSPGFAEAGLAVGTDIHGAYRLRAVHAAVQPRSSLPATGRPTESHLPGDGKGAAQM